MSSSCSPSCSSGLEEEDGEEEALREGTNRYLNRHDKVDNSVVSVCAGNGFGKRPSRIFNRSTYEGRSVVRRSYVNLCRRLYVQIPC